MDFQLILGYTGSSVVQRSQKLLPHSTTTCELSSNRTIQCPKRALKHNSSQVSLAVLNQNIVNCFHSITQSLSAIGNINQGCISSLFQTKMSALRRTVVVNTSVSTPLAATVVSAEVASFCMRTNTTVKKVFYLRFVADLSLLLSNSGSMSTRVKKLQCSLSISPFSFISVEGARVH